LKNKIATQEIRTQLLTILNDGQFHSGEELATRFALTRSAISNHMKALLALGLDIFSVKGRGYQLSKTMELLNKQKIVESIENTHPLSKNLISVENVVASTNDVVKQACQQDYNLPSGYCCLAEAQTAGRGRRGRTWVSQFGSSLYMSMLWRFSNGYQAMAGLSLMICVCVNNTLKELGVLNCKLKWPNDIYYQGSKLAGILIEVEGQVGGDVSAIIGIGINMSLPNNIQGIDQAFTDLNNVGEQRISRNMLASSLIKNLWRELSIFEKDGFVPYMSAWQSADLFQNKTLKLISGNNEIIGVHKGVNEQGALLLEINNTVKAFHGGEISVRAL